MSNRNMGSGQEPPRDADRSADAAALVIAWMQRLKERRLSQPVKAYATRNFYPKEYDARTSRLIEAAIEPEVKKVRDYMLSMDAGYDLDALPYSFLTVEEIYFANMVFRNVRLQRDVIISFTGNAEAFREDVEDMQWFLPWYDCSSDSNYEKPSIGIVICEDLSVSPGVAYVFSDRDDPCTAPCT